MAFKQGQSGNEKGRPKLTEEQKENKAYFLSLLKESTVPALKSIIQIASDEKSRDRFVAAKFIIEKAYGMNTSLLSENGVEAISINIVRHNPAGQQLKSNNNDDCWD